MKKHWKGNMKRYRKKKKKGYEKKQQKVPSFANHVLQEMEKVRREYQKRHGLPESPKLQEFVIKGNGEIAAFILVGTKGNRKYWSLWKVQGYKKAKQIYEIYSDDGKESLGNLRIKENIIRASRLISPPHKE